VFARRWCCCADARCAAIGVIAVAEIIDFASTVGITIAAIRAFYMDAFVKNFTTFTFAGHELLVTRTAFTACTIFAIIIAIIFAIVRCARYAFTFRAKWCNPFTSIITRGTIAYASVINDI